jgi:hypothetical protein
MIGPWYKKGSSPPANCADAFATARNSSGPAEDERAMGEHAASSATYFDKNRERLFSILESAGHEEERAVPAWTFPLFVIFFAQARIDSCVPKCIR